MRREAGKVCRPGGCVSISEGGPVMPVSRPPGREAAGGGRVVVRGAAGAVQAAAGVGRLAGRTVAAYAYSDGAGRRLLIYESAEPFATPAEASRYEGGDAWLTRLDGVSVLCSRAPHRTLVVGQDEEQVTDTAEYLELT